MLSLGHIHVKLLYIKCTYRTKFYFLKMNATDSFSALCNKCNYQHLYLGVIMVI